MNTNQFWDNWNNLKKTDHEELPIQNGEIWESHFQTLFNKVQTDTNCKQNQTINQLEKLELTIKDNQNPLDFPITDKELKEKIKNLQLQNSLEFVQPHLYDFVQFLFGVGLVGVLSANSCEFAIL